MDRWKSRGGKSQRRESEKEEDQRRGSQKTEDAGARKGGKVANVLWPRLAKAAAAEPSGEMRDEKLHAVVARNTFQSRQNCEKLSGSEHFWKLRCRKSEQRCGAKHIWK